MNGFIFIKSGRIGIALRELWPGILAAAIALSIAVADSNHAWFILFNRQAHFLPGGFWRALSVAGEAICAVLLTLPFVRRWRELWLLLLIGTLTNGFVHTLKPLLNSARPAAVLLDQPFRILGEALYTHSFPSGHAVTAFALAGFLILRGGSPWRWIALLPAALVVLSRLAVGAHWPIDVAAGAALGWFCAWFGRRMSERWTWRRHPRPVEWAIALMGVSFVWLLLRPSLGYADDRLVEGTLAFVSLAILLRQWFMRRIEPGA